MKNRNVGFTIVTAAAVALFFGTGSMFAKSSRTATTYQMNQQSQPGQAGQPGQQPGMQPGQAGQAQPGMQPGGQAGQPGQAQSFTGTVKKSSSGTYELSAGGMTYQLSDQSQAAQYNGKQVTVKGTLDSSSNTIQVQQIKPAGGH